MCGWKLGAYPQVQGKYQICTQWLHHLRAFYFFTVLLPAFIKSDKARGFPNLKVKYVRGADPIIKLLDADGAVQEELAIDKWNTDSVEEFLKMHLIMDTSSNEL